MKKEEIYKLKELLSVKTDKVSRAILNVIENRLNESQVFVEYMANVSIENRDENIYYIARDAARYLSGNIELGEWLPANLMNELSEMDNQENETEETECGSIILSKNEYMSLLRRIERLECRVGIRTRYSDGKRRDISGAPSDLIRQSDACKMIGCGKSTIKRWANKGLIIGYKDGIRILYSRSGLKHSKVVRDYMEAKENGEI